MWKADRGIAQLVLSNKIARFVSLLLGIDGVKVGGDTQWYANSMTNTIYVDYIS